MKSFGKILKLIEACDAGGAEAHWRAQKQNANLAWLAADQATTLVDVLD